MAMQFNIEHMFELAWSDFKSKKPAIAWLIERTHSFHPFKMSFINAMVKLLEEAKTRDEDNQAAVEKQHREMYLVTILGSAKKLMDGDRVLSHGIIMNLSWEERDRYLENYGGGYYKLLPSAIELLARYGRA